MCGGGAGSIVSSMSKSPHVSLLSVFVMWKSINLVQAFCFASSVQNHSKSSAVMFDLLTFIAIAHHWEPVFRWFKTCFTMLMYVLLEMIKVPLRSTRSHSYDKLGRTVN